MIWLDVVLAIHDAQITEHGGAAGVRDLSTLESTLARPHNVVAYSEVEPDLAALAASYAFGIACNHPFVDGNKRTSYVAARLFLELNNAGTLTATPAELVQLWTALGAGTCSEQDLAAWLRAHISPQRPRSHRPTKGRKRP